ncbi:MAG: hypothetical protein WC341_00495 [Bacteroidales bacterium]|jgi:hypothetical protein
MSSFLVTPKTISIVAKAIDQNRGQMEGHKITFNALFALNKAALDSRYGKGAGNKAAKEWAEEFSYKEYNPSDLETIKRITCLHYQCSETGTINHPLYKEMGKVVDLMDKRFKIVHKHRASDDPQWQILPWE